MKLQNVGNMLIQRGKVIAFIVLPDRRINTVRLSEGVRRIHRRNGDQIDSGLPHRFQCFRILFQKLPIRKPVNHPWFHTIRFHPSRFFSLVLSSGGKVSFFLRSCAVVCSFRNPAAKGWGRGEDFREILSSLRLISHACYSFCFRCDSSLRASSDHSTESSKKRYAPSRAVSIEKTARPGSVFSGRIVFILFPE